MCFVMLSFVKLLFLKKKIKNMITNLIISDKFNFLSYFIFQINLRTSLTLNVTLTTRIFFLKKILPTKVNMSYQYSSSILNVKSSHIIIKADSSSYVCYIGMMSLIKKPSNSNRIITFLIQLLMVTNHRL